MLNLNVTDLADVTHIGNRNPFLYRGYFYDVEMGLYYLQQICQVIKVLPKGLLRKRKISLIGLKFFNNLFDCKSQDA